MPLNEILPIVLVILAAAVLLLQVVILLRGRGDPGPQHLPRRDGMHLTSDLTTLARQVQSLPPERIHFVTVPIEPYPNDPNRVQWSEQSDDLWRIIRDDGYLRGTEPSPSQAPGGQTATTDADTAVPDEDLLAPADVPVQVVNTTGVNGLGDQASRALRAQGFQTESPATSEDGVMGVTVRYPVGYRAAGLTVAAAFPGATFDVDPALSGQTVLVKLGVGASDVVLVPGAEVTELPAQPITARTVPGGATSSATAAPTIDSQVASRNDLCGDQ